MRGSKPLTEEEIRALVNNLGPADKALFLLGLKTGFRISELLSLTVGDVVSNGKIKDRVTVQRRNMKGKKSSRTVLLHEEARQALKEYLGL